MIWFAIAAITSTPALALLAIVALGERDLIRHERTIAEIHDKSRGLLIEMYHSREPRTDA